MSQPQASSTLVMPDSAEKSLRERSDIGNRVFALMETPGWADLLDGVRAKQHTLTALLMQTPATAEQAVFARATGEMKGVGAVSLIADELVQDGQKADEDLRQLEEEF